MTELPSGTVTFLFTDIEGSTRLLKSLGDRYETVLNEHDRCLRDAFEAAHGQEVDTQGDAFFAVFARAGDAVAAAVDVQRRLPRCAWPEGAEVRVRVGIHTAEPKVGEQRYIGIGVHRAARICAAAHGGQVLLSSATRELVEDSLPEGVELRDLGSHSLKDLDRPEHLFQVMGPNLPHDFPPVRAAGVLVSAETPFAGREGELAAAAHASLKRRVPSRRTVLLAMLAGALAAAVAVPLFALGQEEGGPQTGASGAGVPVPQNSVAAVDAATGKVVTALPVGKLPGPVAVGPEAVWVGNLADDTMSEIDPEKLEVTRTVGLPIRPDAIAVGDNTVWVAYNGCTDTCIERTGASGQRPEDVEPVELAEFDPATSQIVWRRKLGLGGPGAVSVILAEGSLWLSNEADWTVTRVDPENGKVEATISEQVDGPKGVTASAEAVWVLSYPNSWVAKIDPRTGTVVATVPIEKPWAFGAGPAGIWVTTRFEAILWRIHPGRNQTSDSVKIPGLASGIAVGTSRVWVAHRASGMLTRVDPATREVKSTRLGRPIGQLAVGGGIVWVTVF